MAFIHDWLIAPPIRASLFRPKPKPEPKPRDDQPAGEFCDSCHYFYEFAKGEATPDETASGWCRRNPPVYSDKLGHSRYPEVEFSDWCGEWKRTRKKNAD